MCTPTQETTAKIIKLCPGCAMTHLASCERVGGCVTDARCEEAPCYHSCLQHGLCLCKQTCGITDDVTLWDLLSMVFELLVTCSAALKNLAFSMLPVMKYFILLLLYLVDGTICVLEEKRPVYKGLKGAILAASFAFLSYMAYTLLTTFVIPTFNLFNAIFSRSFAIV